MKSTTPFLAAALAATFLAITAIPVHAADKYPSRPVHIVAPTLPGSASDFVGRLLSQKLQERWGQPVLIDYKPGAGQTIGTDFLAKAPADGYTIGLIYTSHVINPSVRAKLPYDTLNDFSGVTLLGYTPILIATAGNSPFNNLSEVLAHARRHPGDLTYATPGVGTSPHFAGEFLGKVAGVDMRHVPFRSGAQFTQDVITGRIVLGIAALGTINALVKSGQLKGIAVTDAKRTAAAPDVPSVSETIPGFSVPSFLGLTVPRGTPREIVHTIRNDIAAILKAPDVVAALANNGFEPVGNTPEEFDRFLAEQMPRWAAIVKQTGITPE
ncbi:MAG: tripartite tricarboxylate transporter substrate binding protein [Pseudomonadota bacterium]